MGIFDIFQTKHSLKGAGCLDGLTDRHSHVLFGVDDGVKTLESSLAVLKYMESVGISALWCTPHIMEDVPNTTASLKEKFELLKAAYNGPIKLHLAAEYMLDNLFEKRLEERDILTMEDDIVLVETSTNIPPVNFYEVLSEILRAGYRPMLAHPERYRYLKEDGYERLKKMGVRFQMNLASVVGYYGQTANNKALWLLQKGYYDEFGSDCHRLSSTKGNFERRVLTRDTVRLLK